MNEVKGEDDYPGIRKAIDALNQGTMRLAELMMDSAVSTALKGKTMDEADLGEGPTRRIRWRKRNLSKAVVSCRYFGQLAENAKCNQD